MAAFIPPARVQPIPVAAAAPPAPHGPGVPFPGNPAGDLVHVLEHIIGLTTAAQRDRITVTAGVTVVQELLLLDEESLLGTLNATISAMARMKLKALKRWAEMQENRCVDIDVQHFTIDECRKIQRMLAKHVSTRTKSRDDSKDKLEELSDRGQHSTLHYNMDDNTSSTDLTQKTAESSFCFETQQLSPLIDKAKIKDGNYDVPVNNFFLVKHIKDNPDDSNGLLIVGTFVQNIYDVEHIFKEGYGSDGSFSYRLNEEAGEGYVHFRKMERSTNGSCIRSTFSVKAPLDIVDVFDMFPFRIMTAKLDIELSTKTCFDNRIRVRPQLSLNVKSKSSNVALQDPDECNVKDNVLRWFRNIWKCGMSQQKEILYDIDRKMDKTLNFDFVSVVPRVRYIVKGGECSKLEVQFFLLESGISKIVKVICPMVLVCVMNFYHVQSNEVESSGSRVFSREYLGNSATFALTIAVLFEHVTPKSRKSSIVCFNTIFLLLVFVALILSSIPAEEDSRGQKYGTIGAWLFICAFIIPFISSFCYFFEKRKIRREFISNEDEFRRDENSVFKIAKHKYDEYFETIVDLVKDVEKRKTLERMGYTPIMQDKNTVVNYNKESKTGKKRRKSCTLAQKDTVNVEDTKKDLV